MDLAIVALARDFRRYQAQYGKSVFLIHPDNVERFRGIRPKKLIIDSAALALGRRQFREEIYIHTTRLRALGTEVVYAEEEREHSLRPY